MVATGMGIPTAAAAPNSVDRYLAKLKDAALHSRVLHAQFHHDTRMALSRGDIEAAVGRCAAVLRAECLGMVAWDRAGLAI